MTQNFLYHYGVKGMKWGVRKERETKGTGKKKTKSNLTKDLRRGEIARAGGLITAAILGSTAVQISAVANRTQTAAGAAACIALTSASAIGPVAVSLYAKKKARENAREQRRILKELEKAGYIIEEVNM